MSSFWIGYGSNYIGGTGSTQSNLAWRLPTFIQGIPAICLALGIWIMPYSPGWLVKAGKDEKAIKSLRFLRNLPINDELVQIKYSRSKLRHCLIRGHLQQPSRTWQLKKKAVYGFGK
jgi:hypothetical protein